MKLVSIFAILILLTFCDRLECAAMIETPGQSGRATIFTIELQSGIAEIWKNLFRSVLAVVELLEPSSTATTATVEPTQEIVEPLPGPTAKRYWKW